MSNLTSPPPTTRKRTSPRFQSSSDPAPTNAEMNETASNLPPPRSARNMRKVSAPLAKARLSTLIYVLVALTALLSTYYGYRAVQYKTAVGGWWNVALGRRPPEMKADYNGDSTTSRGGGRDRSKGKGEDTVEYHINALALALGMPTNDLAAAIAVAVRAYVPPASLSSVKAKETGEAVKVLLQEPEAGEHASAGSDSRSAAGWGGGVVGSMEALVGMDEP